MNWELGHVDGQRTRKTTYQLIFFFFNSGKAGDSGSTSTSDTTRDDSFRSLFSNRLDDFMDSTSSTGDIFPPPLASSRSGGLKTALLGSVVADLIPPPCHLEDAGAHLWKHWTLKTRFTPWPGQYVMFLGKTLLPHSVSLYTGVWIVRETWRNARWLLAMG